MVDRNYLEQAGGGGYGDPGARDAALIERDIDEGYVTAEGAARNYVTKG